MYRAVDITYTAPTHECQAASNMSTFAYAASTFGVGQIYPPFIPSFSRQMPRLRYIVDTYGQRFAACVHTTSLCDGIAKETRKCLQFCNRQMQTFWYMERASENLRRMKRAFPFCTCCFATPFFMSSVAMILHRKQILHVVFVGQNTWSQKPNQQEYSLR